MSGGKVRTMCSPFLRGFLPGIFVGLFTSLLFFSLWRHPSTPESSNELRMAEVVIPSTEIKKDIQQDIAPVKKIIPDKHATDRSDVIRELLDDSISTVQGTYDLLVLVHSAAGQRSLRDAARATWLRNRSRDGVYVARFVIGTRTLDEDSIANLAFENAEYKDLLLLPDIEEDKIAEWPSSEKLLRSLKWAISHVNFTALLKCNTATFVDLETFMKKLQLQERQHVWGYFGGGIKSLRHSNTTGLVEPNWTLCSHYLPYPEGGGYVLSHDIVQLIVDMGPNLNHYLHDDIAVGVWLSPFKGITKQHLITFNTGYHSRGCLNSYLVSHRETVKSMHAKALSLNSQGKLCVNEYQSKLAYRYNWTAPAARCCIRKIGIE